ncbi:hypothetical protein CYG49_03885 [Candidatus Saccharibacteria bacterium]|nr:MAG: hypothetical protein CYG49_03885 [Candidatus Saccharibacteria bacterium]
MKNRFTVGLLSVSALLVASVQIMHAPQKTSALDTSLSQLVYSYNSDGSNGTPLSSAVLTQNKPRIHFVSAANVKTTYVKFYLDGRLVETEGDAPWGLEDDNGSSPLPSDLTKMGEGTHTVKAVATQNGSNRTYSSTFSVRLTTTPVVDEPEVPVVTRYTEGLKIAPTARGKADGSSWENAANLSKLPALVAATPDGGTVLIQADAGEYNRTSSIIINNGGSADKPVTVRGVAKDGTPMKAKIVGDRTAPYSPTGNDGNDLFKFYAGAKNLKFSDLSFQNIGNVFNASADVNNITIEDSYAKNVRRFVSNYPASGEESSNITNLTVRRTNVDGFSKSFAIIKQNSSNLLFEDIVADSQGQDGDDFAMGFMLDGTVHDVVHRRVTVKNTIQTGPNDVYWNADGFVTERGVYNIRYEDTNAMGATDGGYDLKSDNTTLVRAKASDNKRNFRLWGTGVTINTCEGLNPHKRGGTSSQAQLWAGKGSNITISNCKFSDNDADTVVFHLDEEANVKVSSTDVTRNSDATLKRLDTGAQLTIN